MSIPFSPRATLCTAAVLVGFGALVSAQLPNGLYGLVGFGREGLLPVRSGIAGQADDDREIIGAVLRHEARRTGRQNVCLRLADEGRTFEQHKRAMRGLEQQLRREPERRAALGAELERLTVPERRWQAVSEPEGKASPLAPDSAQSLLLAEQRLLTQPAASGVELTLDGGVVPEAFRASGQGCSALSFTAPARSGDIAFVATSFQTGAELAEERLYAVALLDERWILVAEAQP